MSSLSDPITRRIRDELAQEAVADFPRLQRIPQTEVIWFLDYFATLALGDRESLLDALAESASVAFASPGARDAAVAPALARMRELRAAPGSKGGTRYSDTKMLSAQKSLRSPDGYHESWRTRFTPLHFQPRTDLVPSLDDLAPAKAALVRKLVTARLIKWLGWAPEKLPGGVLKLLGTAAPYEAVLRIDFGGSLSQLGYTITLRRPHDQSLAFVQLSYERLWDIGGRWDYVTEENATRSVEFFAEQMLHLAWLAGEIEAVAQRH